MTSRLQITTMMLAAVATLFGFDFCVDNAQAARPEQILEGAMSGAVERFLYYELRDLNSQSSNNWDNKIRVWTGKTKVVFQGINSRVVRIYDHKNHGVWTRSSVKMENARDQLDVKFRNFHKTPGKSELRFQIYVRAMFRGQVEARHYNRGVRLWSATVKGRAKGHIYLNMKVYIYKQGNGYRLGWKAENADIKYSDVVTDRVGHAGGYTARVIGDAFTGAIKQWFPKKEREAIAKARKAVSKAISSNIQIRNDLARVIRMIP